MSHREAQAEGSYTKKYTPIIKEEFFSEKNKLKPKSGMKKQRMK